MKIITQNNNNLKLTKKNKALLHNKQKAYVFSVLTKTNKN